MKPFKSLRVAWIPVLCLSLQLAAHDVITTKLTYTRDIARIFAYRCLNCHSSTSSLPLTTFDEVRPWAVDIKEQVLSRKMPPWGAVKGFGDVSPDHGLNQDEIMIIAAWVIGGSPEGNPALLPGHKTDPPPNPLKPLKDDLIFASRCKLDRALRLAAVRPIADAPVASARITATLPNGRIEPLLWLFRFDPKWPQAFRLRRPLMLPAGTVIMSDSPIRLALQSAGDRDRLQSSKLRD